MPWLDDIACDVVYIAYNLLYKIIVISSQQYNYWIDPFWGVLFEIFETCSCSKRLSNGTQSKIILEVVQKTHFPSRVSQHQKINQLLLIHELTWLADSFSHSHRSALLLSRTADRACAWVWQETSKMLGALVKWHQNHQKLHWKLLKNMGDGVGMFGGC